MGPLPLRPAPTWARPHFDPLPRRPPCAASIRRAGNGSGASLPAAKLSTDGTSFVSASLARPGAVRLGRMRWLVSYLSKSLWYLPRRPLPRRYANRDRPVRSSGRSATPTHTRCISDGTRPRVGERSLSVFACGPTLCDPPRALALVATHASTRSSVFFLCRSSLRALRLCCPAYPRRVPWISAPGLGLTPPTSAPGLDALRAQHA